MLHCCLKQARCIIDPLNLILLIIVVLVGLKLRSVLGTRNEGDHGKSRPNAYGLNRDAFKASKQSTPEDKASNPTQADEQSAGPEPLTPEPLTPELPASASPTPVSPAVSDASQVSETDETGQAPVPAQANDGRGMAYFMRLAPHFDEAAFLTGAAHAYKMILTAFADDDLSEVDAFLDAEVKAGFVAVIEARQAAGQRLATEITRLDRPLIEDARVADGIVQLDVRYRTELISYLYTDDDAARPDPVASHDLWTFEQPLDSVDPNWKLVATGIP